jgi:hypothetical protein
MQSEREPRRRMREIVAARCTAKKTGERATASGDSGGLFAVASGPGEQRVPRSIDLISE